MAVEGNKKLVPIRATLTATAQTVTIVSNARTSTILGVSVPHQCFIYAMQGWGEIRSLDEAFLPVDDPKDSTVARRQKREFFRASAKVGVDIRLQPIGEVFMAGVGKTAGYDFFPVRPGYLVNLFEYLTQADKFGLPQGWEIVARTVDRGYGLLTGSDFISITGWAEDTSNFLQDHNLVVIP